MVKRNFYTAFIEEDVLLSRTGVLRWKEHIKKHKKFLIFLIDNLDFIFLCKIRNDDRTIEYIIQAADIHFG